MAGSATYPWDWQKTPRQLASGLQVSLGCLQWFRTFNPFATESLIIIFILDFLFLVLKFHPVSLIFAAVSVHGAEKSTFFRASFFTDCLWCLGLMLQGCSYRRGYLPVERLTNVYSVKECSTTCIISFHCTWEGNVFKDLGARFIRYGISSSVAIDQIQGGKLDDVLPCSRAQVIET